MYLRECLIENVGPLTAIDVSLDLSSEGNPKPLVLVGKNGAGKSIVLAYVLDALAQLAKERFGDVVRDQRLGHKPFVKVASSGDSRSLSGSHVTLLDFFDGNNQFSYVEKVGPFDQSVLTERLRGRFGSVLKWPDDKQFYKHVTGDKSRIEAIFQSNALCYFPASRHERPHWLNTDAIHNQPIFGDYARIQGRLDKPLITERTADENRQWLLDILLDSLVDADVAQSPRKDGAPSSDYRLTPRRDVHVTQYLQAARRNVEVLLRAVLEDEGAQLVLNYRNSAYGRLGVTYGDGTRVPSLTHLSAGQALLFNLFVTIIRYADRGDLNKSVHLNTIEGIVIVDEIDSHLHSDLQFEVLPRLLKLFPKVQFIVSSHAPLFLLGLEKVFGEGGVQIVELPSGSRIGTERFEEFRRSLDLYRRTQSFEKEIEKQLADSRTPLVLTEGHTDAVFIRTALTLLGHTDLLTSIQVDQIGTSAREGTLGGGDSHLNKARAFLEHNHQRLNCRVLLLYDNETRKPPVTTASFSQRVIPKNPLNDKVPCGIENLLPVELFEDRFYEHAEKSRGDGGTVVIKSLKKDVFCKWVCDERRSVDDFQQFASLLVPIIREFADAASKT